MFREKKILGLLAGLIVGAILVSPAGAHVNNRFGHLWSSHIKPKVLKLTYTKMQADERFLSLTGKASDSDELDGLDSTDFLAATGKATDSDKLDGLNSTDFLSATGKAADSDKLDGLNSTDFLSAAGTAADSDKLDGLNSTDFLSATGKAADSDELDGLDSTDFLSATGKAADSDKLDGIDSADFALDSDLPAPAEGWHIVGTQGEPGFANINPQNCLWQEYEPGPGEWGPVGFFKDQAGVVHLKGMAQMVEAPNNGVCWWGNSQDNVIFILPEAYRPQHTALLTTMAGGKIARLDVKPDGRIMILNPAIEQDALAWVSLDGLSFRVP